MAISIEDQIKQALLASSPFAGGEFGMPDAARDLQPIPYRGQGRPMTPAEIDSLEADRFAREERERRAQERAQETALLTGPVRSWDAKLADIRVDGQGRVILPVDMWRNAYKWKDDNEVIGKEQIKDAIRKIAELGGRDTLNRSVENMLQQARNYYANTPRGDSTWDRNIDGGLIDGSIITDRAFKATWGDIADEVLDARKAEIEDQLPPGFDEIVTDPSTDADEADTEVQSAATMTDSELMDLDEEQSKQFAKDYLEKLQRERDGEEVVEVEDTGIPENLPQFWKDRYGEYQALSPELQQIILLNGIQNYIELEPYQLAEAGIANAGIDPTQVDPTQVDPTQITGFEGDQPDYVNPMTGVGPVTPFRAGMPDFGSAVPEPLTLEGVPVNSLGDMLNLFYANPDQYIVEQPVLETYTDENGVVQTRQVGTQQSLSPLAQAALQAFSTQRGAESADIASRFGTTSPFGAIAGLGGETAAQDALTLAELQAKAGVNNPFAALQTDAKINDISTILRGGLTSEQQLALAQAPGNPFGLTAQQQIDLQNQLARGGISPEQRLAEQRMALLPQLFQTSPQALGGLQRILGEAQLQEALTPFFSAGNFQPVPPPEPSSFPVPFYQTQPGFDINPDIALGAGSPASTMMPSNQPITQNISSTTQPVSAVSPGFRPTVGQYQRADLFDRGGFEADAAMSGKQLTPFLQEVTPLAAPTRPGGLGARTTTRFTY